MSTDQMLGPYRLLRTLGQGGMGTVYLAHDDTLHRHVAVKVLRQQDLSPQAQTAMTKRFMREARAAARLNHRHVATIYAVGQTEGACPRPYLVMEYVEEGSLADHLHAHGVLDWRAAAHAIRDALAALTAAHDAGIIHRDIKPANLMRAKDGAIKLVDFGLARALETMDADLTVVGAFVGSPSYASPEQAAGAALIDGRSDLYSLAATWHALLAGRPPFLHDDPAEILRMHLHQPFPDFAPAVHVPPLLKRILDKAAAKHPEDRYATAADMREAVDDLLRQPDATPLSHAPKLVPSHSHDSLHDLESRLSLARLKADSSTQLAALRSLYGLYTQLDRREDATKVFREALVLHVQLQAPARPSAN
jgi:eukaryotic-like serine/threonine-protein kinase